MSRESTFARELLKRHKKDTWKKSFNNKAINKLIFIDDSFVAQINLKNIINYIILLFLYHCHKVL